MRMIRWEPFRDLDHVFDHFFADAYRRFPREAGDAAANGWAPLADVSETAGEYLIKAELPEVRKEDVKVTVQDGVLTLAGERRQEKREDTEKLHRIERRYGAFERRFALPEDADEGSISAESRDGVLVIRVPKHKVAQPEPRQIQIQ